MQPELKKAYDDCWRAGELFDVIASEVNFDEKKINLIKEFGKVLFVHGFKTGSM